MVTTRALVAAGVACVAIALAWRRLSSGATALSAPTPKKPGSKARRKVKTAAKQVKIPAEFDFIGMLLSSMERIRSTGLVSGPQETELAAIVEAAAATPDNLSVRARLMAAQWMILFQTLLAVTSDRDTPKLSGHENAMRQAWVFLDVPLANLSPDERSAVDILQLDVSQRSRSPELMLPVYERLIERQASASLSNEETLVLFTSAPLLGRWADTRRIGTLISQQQSLDEFHQAALQRPELPDYSVLYEQAVSRALPDTTDLAWAAYRILQLRIRLRDVESSEPQRSAEVRAVVANDWQVTPITNDTYLFRHGAIGQMMSASEVKISCVGPWDSDHVELLGYADLDKDTASGGGQVRQTERYQISRDGHDTAGELWSGTYTLEQNDQGSTIKIMFDLEMKLALDQALSPATSAKA